MNPPFEINGNEPPEWAKNLIAEVAALKAAIAKPEVDPLDALEKEIVGNGEEKVTMPAEILTERLKREKEREKAKARAAEASYDSRNPHKKKRDQTARAGL